MNVLVRLRNILSTNYQQLYYATLKVSQAYFVVKLLNR